MYGCEERVCAFGISRGDTSPLFEVEEGIFNQVAQFVEMLVVVARLFAVLARRNLRLHALAGGLLHDSVAIVAFVGDQVPGFQPFNQRASR